MIQVIDAHEDREQCLRRGPSGVHLGTGDKVRDEIVAHLSGHAEHRCATPGEVVGLHDAGVVLCCHVHDIVGSVAGGVAFVGVWIAEWVTGAGLDTGLPVEAGSCIGCAAGEKISKSSQGYG